MCTERPDGCGRRIWHIQCHNKIVTIKIYSILGDVVLSRGVEFDASGQHHIT